MVLEWFVNFNFNFNSFLKNKRLNRGTNVTTNDGNCSLPRRCLRNYETTKRLNPANISNFLDILLYDRRKKKLLQFSDQDGSFAINSDVSVKEEQLGRHHKTLQRTQIAVPIVSKKKRRFSQQKHLLERDNFPVTRASR